MGPLRKRATAKSCARLSAYGACAKLNSRLTQPEGRAVPGNAYAEAGTSAPYNADGAHAK
jgi:hypothetical protein